MMRGFHQPLMKFLGRSLRLKEGVIGEVEERIAGDALGIGGPRAPAEIFGERGFVGVVEEFELGLAVVEDV